MNKDAFKDWVEHTLALDNTSTYENLDGVHFAVRILGRGEHLAFQFSETIYIFAYEWVDHSIDAMALRAWTTTGDLKLTQEVSLIIAKRLQNVWFKIYKQDTLRLRHERLSTTQ